jgi:hypothetical protein
MDEQEVGTAGLTNLADLIEKRQAVCRACISFRDSSVPFCVWKCGAQLQYKWAKETERCPLGKW